MTARGREPEHGRGGRDDAPDRTIDDASARPPLWTVPFVLLTISNLCVSFTFYILVATMAGHAVREFGANQTEAGLASSAFFFGGLAARLFAGRVLVRYGTRAVTVWSLVLLCLACLAYLLPATLASTLVLRVIHGIGFGFSATALASGVMGQVPPARRGEGSGWFTSGMAIATGIAPFVGLSLVNRGAGQQAVFGVTALCAVIAVLCAVGAARSLPVRSVSPADGAGADASSAGRLIERRAVPIGVVVGLCAFPFATILAFLNLYAAERDLTTAASWYFFVYAAVILVSRPGAGMLQDRRGDDVVAVPIVVCVAIGTVLTGLASGPVVLLLGAAFLGLGYGTLTSVGQAISVSKVSAAGVGLAVSSYFLLVDLGTGLGPVVLGPLVGALGYPGTFFVSAVFPLVGLAVYLLIARRVPSCSAR